MDMRLDKYVNVSIPRSIINEVDKIIREGNLGYESRAEFMKDGARKLLSLMKERPRFQHVNTWDNHVKILDNWLETDGRIIPVYFKIEGARCGYCRADHCVHVDFAWSIPDVEKILTEKGVKRP